MSKSNLITICICLSTFVILGQNESLKHLLANTRPVVCGHRGGFYPVYPENSIAVTNFILDKINQRPIMVEIDLRSDKDGKIWLMHDATLERTTDGFGNIGFATSEYLNKLSIKSQNGQLTKNMIVSLEEYLQFTTDKPIYLMLDIKDDKLYPKIDALLRKYNMSDRSLILTFSIENTKRALDLTSNILISTLISNSGEFNDFQKLQAYYDRLGAYVTDATPDSLINYLKKANIPLISDPRELWNKRIVPEISSFYHSFIRKKQLNILVTDFPVEVIQMLNNENELHSKILNIHLKKFKWMEEKQLDSLSTLLHNDVHYIHSNGWKETKEELLHNIQSNKLSYQGVTIHESEVRLEGNTGIVTGKGTFNVSLDGKPIEIQLYYTEVYVITENGIKLLSRHACKY